MAEGQVFEQLNAAKVSPFIVENRELSGFLLIPLVLLNLLCRVAKKQEQ